MSWSPLRVWVYPSLNLSKTAEERRQKKRDAESEIQIPGSRFQGAARENLVPVLTAAARRVLAYLPEKAVIRAKVGRRPILSDFS